jgi:hypothetical protein
MSVAGSTYGTLGDVTTGHALRCAARPAAPLVRVLDIVERSTANAASTKV